MATTSDLSHPRRRFDYAEFLIATAFGLAITMTALYLGLMPLLRAYSGSRDFVVYWATGQQLVHHANPYDPAAMGHIEHAAGYTGKGSYYMRNPPWSLPLAFPLGFVGTRLAALPWSLLMLGLLGISVRALWMTFGRPAIGVELLGYVFPPALICVVEGQTSLFLLLGLALFLRNHRTRPFLAGAALWFCTLKPHLFLPFAVVLLVWIAVSRSYRILLGAAASMTASCLLTEWIDPSAWAQYIAWGRTSGISREFIPCLSVALRELLDPAAKWLVFVPAALACAWALIYFWRRRHGWDWIEHGNLLMLVSIVAAPYCWLYDQSLALPALMCTAGRVRSRRLLAVLASAYLLLELQPFFSSSLASALYLWPAPAWLVWYLAARKSAADVNVSQPESKFHSVAPLYRLEEPVIR